MAKNCKHKNRQQPLILHGWVNEYQYFSFLGTTKQTDKLNKNNAAYKSKNEGAKSFNFVSFSFFNTLAE